MHVLASIISFLLIVWGLPRGSESLQSHPMTIPSYNLEACLGCGITHFHGYGFMLMHSLQKKKKKKIDVLCNFVSRF
jgi:hypothetical protein